MKVLIAFLFVAVATVRANVCEDLDDGEVPEFACRVYTVCQGGQPQRVECPEGEAYDSSLRTCNDIMDVPHPCGFWRDCTGMENKRYVDDEFTGCTSYYTCQNEIFFGFNTCPQGLVYDESMQLCNWPTAVAPPCGSCVTC